MFIHQLRAHANGKILAVIMDNVSYHNAKYIKMFREKYDDVKFFFLPSYSPEYNPTEQVWKWSKPLVHAAKTINGGLDELLSRFRKLFAHRRNDRLASSLNVGLGFWQIIL
jgi:transposase